MNKYPLVRKIYLYLFSLVGLVLITIGAVRLVDLGLKIFVFTEADKMIEYPAVRQGVGPDGKPIETPDPKALAAFNRTQQRSQRQRDAAGAIAQIIVGLPLYLYHWSIIKREKETEG